MRVELWNAPATDVSNSGTEGIAGHVIPVGAVSQYGPAAYGGNRCLLACSVTCASSLTQSSPEHGRSHRGNKLTKMPGIRGFFAIWSRSMRASTAKRRFDLVSHYRASISSMTRAVSRQAASRRSPIRRSVYLQICLPADRPWPWLGRLDHDSNRVFMSEAVRRASRKILPRFMVDLATTASTAS